MYYDDDLDGLISYRLYDSLKWLGLIVFPGLGVFLGTIGPYFINNYDPLHSLLVVSVIELSNGLILSLCQSMAKIDKKEIEEEKKQKEEENSSE